MFELGKVLQEAALPVFGLALAGVFMRRWNWLTEEADHSLLRVTVNVLAPALVLDSILGNEALRSPGNLLLPPLIGFLTIAFGAAVAWWLARRLFPKQPTVVGTFALCVGFYNYGYVPLPIARALFDKETVGVLFVHNLGVDLAMWTLGVFLLNPALVKQRWQKALNPPVIAILVAVVLNLLGLHAYIPKFLKVVAHMLGQCAIPMGLILIGATIADHWHEFPSSKGWPIITSSCFLRLALIPVCFLLLARYLPCSVELKRVIVMQAAMPSAVFPIIMTRHYGGDPGTALRVVVGTSLLGFLTIPLWLRFGLKFVGI